MSSCSAHTDRQAGRQSATKRKKSKKTKTKTGKTVTASTSGPSDPELSSRSTARRIMRSVQFSRSFKHRVVQLTREHQQRWAAEHEREHAIVAMRCLCALLVAAPHFNYAPNVLTVVVGKAGSPLKDLRDVCQQKAGGAFAESTPR